MLNRLCSLDWNNTYALQIREHTAGAAGGQDDHLLREEPDRGLHHCPIQLQY